MAISNLVAGEPVCIGGQVRVPLTWSMPNGTAVTVFYRDKAVGVDVAFATGVTATTINIPYVVGHYFVITVRNEANEVDRQTIGNGGTVTNDPQDYRRTTDPCATTPSTPSTPTAPTPSTPSTPTTPTTPTAVNTGGGAIYVPPTTTTPTVSPEATASSGWAWYVWVIVIATFGGIGYLGWKFIKGGKKPVRKSAAKRRR